MQNINNDFSSFYQDCGYIFPNNINFSQNNNKIAMSQTTFPTMNIQSDDLSHNKRNNIALESETNILPQYQISNFQLSLSEEDSSDIKQLLISWDLSDIVDTCLSKYTQILKVYFIKKCSLRSYALLIYHH